MKKFLTALTLIVMVLSMGVALGQSTGKDDPLTPEEAAAIEDYKRRADPTRWRYLHMFLDRKVWNFFSIDRKRITRQTGDRLNVWLREDYIPMLGFESTPVEGSKAIDYTLKNVELNCPAVASRVLREIYYSYSDGALEDVKSPNSEMTSEVPGSIGEHLNQKMCATVLGSKD